MEVKTVAIESLTLDPNNARKHPEKNLEAIKGSLLRFGQQKPIVVDKQGIVIAGNGTLAAARALGWTSISVVESTLEKWNAMAYALADNRTAELASWDEEVLRDQIKALADFHFPLPEIGFELSDFTIDEPINPNEVEGSTKMSEEIGVDKEFLVLVFESEDEFVEANKFLNNDFRCGYWLSKHKKNPAFFRKGPNRVLSGELFIKNLRARLEGARSNE